MLVPLGHEQMSARRWPIITFALIAINLAVFVATRAPMDEQRAQFAQVKAHILMLAAVQPELRMPADVQAFVENFRQQNPGLWRELQQPNRDVADAWDAKLRMTEGTYAFQTQMDSLAGQYAQLTASSITEQYAFTPANIKPAGYVTANFLHVGWLHLIGNLWFLWLAGFVLEDVWGRFVYSAFYLVAGAVALQFHAWMHPGSLVPVLGASGAVAGLMGAFLVRFPAIRIEMAWLFWVRLYRFKMRAYWLLPLWLLMEIFSGTLFGQMTGVAHWAHVGGFAFGVVIALALRFSGVEHKLNEAIESQVSLTSDPEISQATELLGQSQYDEAVTVLKKYLAGKPESVEACVLLQQAYWRKGDVPAYREAAIRCCQLDLKAREYETAWQTYEDFLNAGGDRSKVPAATWLELGRAAEKLENYDRALTEYQKLAAAHPSQRPAVEAQLAAAKIFLKRLNRPQDALKLYEAAAASAVPHLDLEPAINAGVRDARALVPAAQAATAGS